MTALLAWSRIQTVLLDMDGTLLDLRFDNHFWRELIPSRYAERHGLPLAQAHAEVAARTRQVEGSLDWYCLDYWTRELALDVVTLKREIEHLIAPHPHVEAFLDALRVAGKRVVLVTNAHPRSLALKMERTDLAGRFDAIVCAHDLGLAKEQPEFWPRLREREPFEPAATLLVDDNLPILRMARAQGIAYLVSVLRPDSTEPPKPRGEFPAIHDFSELLPVEGAVGTVVDGESGLGGTEILGSVADCVHEAGSNSTKRSIPSITGGVLGKILRSKGE